MFRAQPPDPAAFTNLNLNPQTTEIQVWTQIINSPAPHVTTAVDNGVTHNPYLDFGKMGIGQGAGFFIPGQGDDVGLGNVRKHWVQINGSTFLVEEMDWTAIAGSVQALPQH